MQLCAAYYRVSTVSQREARTIESQKARAPIDMALRGLTLVREYEDDGESATTLHNRRGLLSLLTDAGLGIFDTVWVIDMDRFDRSSGGMEWAYIKGTLKKHGITVITPSQTTNLNDDSQEFTADILNTVAAFELRKIRARMSHGRHAAARAGRYIGGTVPFGYYRDEKNEYRIDPQDSEVYLDMVRWVEEGASLREVVKRLEEQGVKSPQRRDHWSIGSVAHILHAELYSGVYRRWLQEYVNRKPGKNKPTEEHSVSQMPMLIAPERWERLQAALTKKNDMSKRARKKDYLLSKLLYCASCESLMTGEYIVQTGKRQYACSSHRRGLTKCPAPYVEAGAIEERVWELLTEHVHDLSKLRSTLEKRLNVQPTMAVTTVADRLEGKRQEEARVLSLFVDGLITDVDMKQRLKKIVDQRTVLEHNIEVLKHQRQMQDTLAGANTVLQVLEEYHDRMESTPYPQRRRVLEWLFYGPRLGIYHQPDHELELRTFIPVRPGLDS